MNSLQYKTSLKNKLTLLVAVAVMLVAIALGLYFDYSLKNNSLSNAQTRLSHAYQRLAYNLKNIEAGLKEGIDIIRSDEQMQASIELINNYQDKNNYDTYLIDEEKKSIANQLLNRVKFLFNNDVALYDKNDELIAFVDKRKEGYQLNYISYVNAQARLLKRYEHQREYFEGGELKNPNISALHVPDYNPEHVNKMSLITYKHLGGQIVIKSHQNIIDKHSNKIIGHIEMSRVLDDAYFSELSQTLNLELKHSFNSSLEENAMVMNKNVDVQHLNIIQDNKNYSIILKQADLNGVIYYIANLNKNNLNLLLTEGRKQFLIILILVTLSVLLLMRYIINRNLARPLSVLMKQIEKIEHQDYSELTPIKSGDELEAASININRLAHVIKEREAHLHTLIHTLPDLVWLKDPDGVYLGCNKKFELLFGAKEADIVGKTDYDFVNKDLADFFRKHDKDAMAAGEPTVNEEEVIYASDGHREQLETIKTPMLSVDGVLIGVLGVGRDITERKKFEEKLTSSSSRLKKLASRLPGMVYQFELDVDGNMSFPYMSEAVEDIYHLTAKEVLEDVNSIFSLTHPDDVEKLNSSIMESARTFIPWKLEYRIIDEDGSVRWLYGNSIPEKKPEGGVMWYGFVTDITKNKEIDETLRRSQKMDALGKLTGGIAHDYNNMLGVVLGYAELLKEMLGDKPELQDYVEQIIHAGDRGSKLTNKLLSFSRQKLSDAEAIDINKVINNEQHMLEKTLTARIQLLLKLDEGLWPVCLEESELEDAILNICINAMHAIKNNGQLTIETHNEIIDSIVGENLELDAGDYVHMCISDTGCGLDESSKEKIFDPFYSTKGDKGTGLGLTQVYGFIKRSGGAIKVDSVLEQGSKFNLYFPRAKSKTENSDETVVDDKLDVNGNETILVVDDEASLLNLASNILMKYGYKVYCVESADKALELMKEKAIDILLSDIIMPNMDGYELAAIVQEKYPDTRVQLVSGFSGDKDHEDNILSKSILKKPYKAKDLIIKIQGILNS